MTEKPPEKREAVMTLREMLTIAVGGSVVAVLLGVAIIYFRYYADEPSPRERERAAEAARPAPGRAAPAVYETPAPPSIPGGAERVWKEQALRFTLPAGWEPLTSDAGSCSYRSGAKTLAALASITTGASSPLDATAGLEGRMAYQKQAGAALDLRFVEIDGVKGAIWVDGSSPSSAERRIQWTGYRSYKGATQSIGLVLSCPAADFEREREGLYQIVYATKIAKD